MNYLEFKRFFHQINSDKAFVFISVDWTHEFEYVVYGDKGTAQDFASDYDIQIALSSILEFNQSQDIIIVFASESSISAIVESCSVEDLASSYYIEINSSVDIDSVLSIDLLVNHFINTLDTTITGDTALPKDAKSNYNAIIDYVVVDFWAYEIVDMLIAYSHLFNISSASDTSSVAELVSTMVNEFNYSGDLDTASVQQLENIVMSFVTNFTTIVEYSNTTDFTNILEIASIISSNIETYISKDFATYYQFALNISSSIQRLREASLSDYSDNYISEIETTTLYDLMYIIL